MDNDIKKIECRIESLEKSIEEIKEALNKFMSVVSLWFYNNSVTQAQLDEFLKQQANE